MDSKMIAALPWLLEIAKKKEFPDSVFAVESMADVMWNIARENGSDDPESCEAVTAQCNLLGASYEEILNLYIHTVSTELNTRFEKGKDSIEDLFFGLCMIAATKLDDTGSEVIHVEWSMWDGYDPTDLIRLPTDRFALIPDIPYTIFSQIVNIYGRSGMYLDTLLGEVAFRMKQIFERDRDKFVIRRLSELQL